MGQWKVRRSDATSNRPQILEINWDKRVQANLGHARATETGYSYTFYCPAAPPMVVTCENYKEIDLNAAANSATKIRFDDNKGEFNIYTKIEEVEEPRLR